MGLFVRKPILFESGGTIGADPAVAHQTKGRGNPLALQVRFVPFPGETNTWDGISLIVGGNSIPTTGTDARVIHR